MATLTIELSLETAARLAREAQERGIDLQTYVRLILGDQDGREAPSRDPDPDRAAKRHAHCLLRPRLAGIA
jgi:hypothetical protein